MWSSNTVLVIGVAAGIGRACATMLAAQSAAVPPTIAAISPPTIIEGLTDAVVRGDRSAS
jgi:NAD(P)-dependent dehydrogenase (short-subunit alcohol dehydrogenase family)